jgi:hypothetical protein
MSAAPNPPPEWYGLREDIRKTVQFPVPMDGDDPFQEPLRRTLEALWIQWVAEFPRQVRSEGDLAERLATTDLEDFHNVAELRSDLINLKRWIRQAERSFRDVIYVLGWTKYKDPRERIKHLQRRGISDSKVRELTKGGESMFFSRVTDDLLLRLFWLIMSKRAQELLDKARTDFYLETDVGPMLGASADEDTRFILYKMDYSTPEVHAYPLLEREIPSSEPIDRLSEWFEAEEESGGL